MSRFLNSLTIMLFMLSVSVYSQHELRHYTVEDGLSNNQIRQLIELPNGQILVGTEGSFGLFNGKEFVSLRCRHDSLYRLPRFGSHAHLWNGDSILWLKDYYNLYKFNVSRRIFTYDYGKISTNGSLYQFIHEDGDSAKYSYLRSIESNRDRFSTILSSFGIEN